ncbi:MAG TPA: hypothetical protein VFC26_10035, partial [Verrucomicrobiae bacterium]|nr:hypothetical protein [Verrucomicrobiae bacterium]
GRDFGTNPDDLIAYVEDRNGIRTLLPIISATDTEIIAKVGIVLSNAQMGPIIVARGIGIRSFPTVPGITAPNGIVSWNLIPGLQGIGPEFHPFFPNLCDSSFFGYPCVVDISGVLHDGLCLVIEGDTPPNATVKVDYFFDLLAGYSAGSVEFQTISQPLSAPLLASAIRSHALNHLYPTVVGLPSALPDNKALLQFVDLRVSPTGIPFSLQGHINVCISTPTPVFGGLLHVAKGQAQLNIDDLARLIVSNLGPSGNDGVRVELGAAQGWAADFTPFKLGHGQRLTVSHFGSPDGISTQRMARTWMEVDDGRTFLSSDWSYVGTDRYVLVIQNELGRALEWAVFGNNERVAVDNYFPQICNEQATTYSASVFVDQHWMRFCKTGCDCFGTNCWHEILACTFPFDSRLLTNMLATAVELNLGSLATTSRVAEAIAAEPFLTSLTFSSEHVKSLGHLHQALGQATLEAEANRLRVANFGSDGLDGIAIKFDRLANFLGLSPVRGHQIALEPFAIPAAGSLRLAARGSTGTLATAVFRNAGSSLQISADFAPVGATQALVEVYRDGTRVGSAFAAMGAHIALTPADIRNQKLEVYDYPGEYASRFGGVFEGAGSFLLPSGASVMGNEIRLLAVDANNDLTDTLSRLEITGTGLNTLTIVSETSLDILLRVEHLGGSVRVFWPKPADGFLLQETSTLGGSPIPWTQVPASTYQTNQTDIFIIVPAPSANKFYRLRRP